MQPIGFYIPGTDDQYEVRVLCQCEVKLYISAMTATEAERKAIAYIKTEALPHAKLSEPIVCRVKRVKG